MQVLQLVISGIALGCIYGLIALGFVLIYKATETVSFAQGELMMLGAFAGLVAMNWLGFRSRVRRIPGTAPPEEVRRMRSRRTYRLFAVPRWSSARAGTSRRSQNKRH